MPNEKNTIAISESRTLKISTGLNRFKNRVKTESLKWPAFIERLRHPTVTNETFSEFSKSKKSEKDNIKDVGYFIAGKFREGKRKISNLEYRDCVVLDYDHGAQDYEFGIDMGLGGMAHCYYSTHSHSKRSTRLRIVIPLTRSIKPEEYAPISRMLANQVSMDEFDDTTYQPSRLMYWPSVSKDAEYVFHVNEGPFCDPDKILAMYDDWTDHTTWPMSSRELENPAKVMRQSAKKAQDPHSKTGVVGAFCRTYGIHEAIAKFLPEVYLEGTIAGRYSYNGSTTVNGAVVYDDKFLCSHHETDPVGGRTVNVFDLVRIHRFGAEDINAQEGTPHNRLPSYKLMCEFAESEKDVKKDLVKETIRGFEPVQEADEDDYEDFLGPDPAKKDKKKQDPEKTKNDDWMTQLETDRKGRIYGKLNNIILLIQHDPKLEGLVGLNELSGSTMLIKDSWWRECTDKKNGVWWNKYDDLHLRNYLEGKYEGLEVSDQRINDAINFVAYQNRFHPIKTYLNTLEWDGVPRLETMLHRHLGVKRDAYTDSVSRKVLCGAVARVFNPGCKFDYMMVLEGKQGKGKSTFIKALAGAWFGDNITSFKGKEAVESMQGQWIIELAELQAFGKAEIEHIKAFITRQEDRVRLAYDRRPSIMPRQTIFIGTTNDDQYLRDETGNRRFWPVHCEARSIDIDAVKAERDQLWAEAVYLYEQGEDLYLDDATEELAREAQAERVPEDPMAGLIKEYLERPIRADHWEFDTDTDPDFADEVEMVERDRVCIREIWVECMGGSIKDLTKAKANQIGAALKQTIRALDGWDETPKTVKFGSRYGSAKGYMKDQKIEFLG